MEKYLKHICKRASKEETMPYQQSVRKARAVEFLYQLHNLFHILYYILNNVF